MTRNEAMVDLRREAGFDPHLAYIESIDLCLWIITKVDEPLARQACASRFREFLATSHVGGCQ